MRKISLYRLLGIIIFCLFLGLVIIAYNLYNSPYLEKNLTIHINIKDYGAKADGITDDSIAFKKAFAAAQSQKLPLYLPAGTYNLNFLTIWSSSADMTIFGDGADKTILKNLNELHFNFSIRLLNFSIENTTGYCIYLSPKTNITVNVENVNCNGDADYSGKTAFLHISNNSEFSITDAYINNCKVSNVNRAIILASNISKCVITNCTFENLGNLNADFASGIYLGYELQTRADNVLISNNTIKNLYTANSPNTTQISEYKRAYGILVYGDNIEISNNHIENIIGGLAHCGIYTKSSKAKILNNTITNAGDGGGCIVNKKDDASDYIVRGNKIYVDKQPASLGLFNGIYFYGKSCIIEDNHIDLLTGGIVVTIIASDYADYNDFVNIKNNNLTTTGHYIMYINKAVGTVLVSDNIINQNNKSNALHPASFAFCNTSDNCIINFSHNKVFALNAMIFNSWNCSASTQVNFLNNDFSSVSDIFGKNRLNLNIMKANYN